MLNAKKILMVVTASVLGLGLSGCGKDNYNGQYTGSEISIPQQGQQQQPLPNQPLPNQPQTPYYPQGQYMGQQYRQVTVNLSHNGDIVTGDYTATNTGMGGMNYPSQMPMNSGMNETYRLEATARSANRLDEVRLIPMNNMYGSNCILQGALDAVEDGARLQGTLSPVNVTTQSGMGYCAPKQITLDRIGER
jgi:hypothetical protein